MAEVLITLGIIGIIAAMTLGIIIDKYQKVVTANKLKKFYSLMQQAITLTSKDYGELIEWLPTAEHKTSDGFEKWYNLYIGKHLQTISQKKLDNTFYQVGLIDGSGFVGYNGVGVVYIFYCTELKYCADENTPNKNVFDGRNSFLFEILKTDTNKAEFITSHIQAHRMTREELLESCKYGNWDNPENSIENKRHTCTRLIEYDGWEIKSDYPWRQTIIKK